MSGCPCFIFWVFPKLRKPTRASPLATSSGSVAHRELHPRTPQGAGYGICRHRQSLMASLSIMYKRNINAAFSKVSKISQIPKQANSLKEKLIETISIILSLMLIVGLIVTWIIAFFVVFYPIYWYLVDFYARFYEMSYEDAMIIVPSCYIYLIVGFFVIYKLIKKVR